LFVRDFRIYRVEALDEDLSYRSLPPNVAAL